MRIQTLPVMAAVLTAFGALSLTTACAAPATDGAHAPEAQHESQHASHKTDSTYLKPGPAVAMDAERLTLARAGDVGTVEVRIAGDGDDLRAALGSSTGLEVLGATVRDVAAGDILRVDVRAPSEGRHYLDVIVTDAQGQPRAMSVAVQVGKDTTVVGSKPAEMIMGADGQLRRIMPAAETIDGVAVQTDGER